MESGLGVTFTSLAGTTDLDVAVTPGVALYVPAGETPSPFLSPGRFRAVWEGSVLAELRGDFIFGVEVSGEFQLEINRQLVLSATNSAGAAILSPSVRLNKGVNALKATFTAPPQGDAFVRLGWTERGTNVAPIPTTVFAHTNTAALDVAAQRRVGRALFFKHRCARCHDGEFRGVVVPELNADAPTFEGIGARRRFEWLARWILDPAAQRPSAQMPRLLHAATARQDAEAIATYLASLNTGGEVPFDAIRPVPSPTSAGASAPGESGVGSKPLFERLHCVGCHDAPDAPPTAAPSAGKIPLAHVAEKFLPGRLADFLRQPEAHFAWTRMPNFRLTEAEANELADFLTTHAKSPAPGVVPTNDAVIARGRELVQMSGCLKCHAAPLENRFRAPKLAALRPDLWQRGCLASDPPPNSPAPRWHFSESERAALRAFGQTDRASLTRHVPAEFAERSARSLQCDACHGQLDGFPPLDHLGSKLRPEWIATLLAGQLPYKPRGERHPNGEPWLTARMPAFASRAKALAAGLAAQHGLPPRTPTESPIDNALAKAGHKLVGKDGGFSCISCHGVGSLAAMEVFESEGINLRYASERLLPAYFRRWMRQPLAIDPQTKMPAYFEDGKSQLTEILGGDAEQQIGALWHYLRLADQMPRPVSN